MKTLRGLLGCNQDLKGSLFCCPPRHLSVIQSKSLIFHCMNPVMAAITGVTWRQIANGSKDNSQMLEKWELDCPQATLSIKLTDNINKWLFIQNLDA